jgi:hypothetical protein
MGGRWRVDGGSPVTMPSLSDTSERYRDHLRARRRSTDVRYGRAATTKKAICLFRPVVSRYNIVIH